MNLKFIGKDGSMGLKHGEVYDVRVRAHRGDDMIIVQWGFVGAAPIYCPYSSPASFAANWAKPGQPQKVVVGKKKTVKDGPWRVDYKKTTECHEHDFIKSHYCPHCGAIMDGGKNGKD